MLRCHSLISPLFGALSLIALMLVQVYRYAISPLIFCLAGPCCRFTPSCSEYALICLKRDPLPRALKLIALRLLKCHPLSRKSGVDLP